MDTKTETTYDQVAPTLTTKTAIQERQEQANGKKKQVWIKNADFTAFSLQAFLPGFEIPYALETVELGDDKEKATRIKYQSEAVQFVQDAVNARVEASAKAKIASGNEPPTSLEELLSTSRGGQYMADMAAVRKHVSAYLLGKGNSEAKTEAVVALLDPRVLKKANDGSRQTVIAVLSKVGESGVLESYQTVVDNLLSAAQGEQIDVTSVEL